MASPRDRLLVSNGFDRFQTGGYRSRAGEWWGVAVYVFAAWGFLNVASRAVEWAAKHL